MTPDTGAPVNDGLAKALYEAHHRTLGSYKRSDFTPVPWENLNPRTGHAYFRALAKAAEEWFAEQDRHGVAS